MMSENKNFDLFIDTNGGTIFALEFSNGKCVAISAYFSQISKIDPDWRLQCRDLLIFEIMPNGLKSAVPLFIFAKFFRIDSILMNPNSRSTPRMKNTKCSFETIL